MQSGRAQGYDHFRKSGNKATKAANFAVFGKAIITMKPIDQSYQVLYSELAQRALDASFTSDFSVDGRFVTQENNNRRYWYFDTAKDGGGKNRRYVGPVDDPDITARVEAFKDLKADVRARRKLVSTLVREAYLPRPESLVGDIIQALAEGGFFRLRGVLVGTAAYPVYSAVLGTRLANTAMQTGDLDVAQFYSVSEAVEDSMPPVLDLLREVSPTFREIPHQLDGRHVASYIDRSGFRVEFLTPNTGSDDYASVPALMPALGGASAQPLRFLDFLIHDPVRAVLLHGPGVPILVPAPARYAVHKLIVASRRREDRDGTAKSAKDLMQAVTLMEAMIQLRRAEELADAYAEAWKRGPHWREAIHYSLGSVGTEANTQITAGIAIGMKRLNLDPEEYRLLAP